MIELVSTIVPFFDELENSTITKSYVINNKKLLANAVYVFEKKSLPLCSRRYQKISNTTCTSKLCEDSRYDEKNPYTYQASEQELRDFCVADYQYGRTS
jgi:hypothetical protein